MSDPFGGCMSSVSRSKGIIHIDLGKGCQLPGKFWIVLFFFWMKANVLEQDDFARMHLEGAGSDFLTDAVRQKWHVLSKQFGQSCGDWS